MIRSIRTILAAAALVSLAAALPLARADDAAEAASRLAGQPGFRARIEARDAVAGRTFTATVLYRSPDHALALIPPRDWVAIDGGRVSVFEDGALRTCDVGAWLRRTGASLATCVAEARRLGGAEASAAAPAPLDLAGAAERLGIALEVDMRRLEGKVGIALLLQHAIDPAAARAPGFCFRTGDQIAVTYGAFGFPETLSLRGPTGRVEAELRTSAFDVLSSVPEELLRPPATTATAEVVEPAPRLKEAVVRQALAALLGPLRAGAAKDPGLLEREADRVDALLVDAYTAIFAAGYDEGRLRTEARRAVRSEADVVLAAVKGASSDEKKAKVKAELKKRFADNCRRQLKDAIGELVRIVEAVLVASPDAGKADDAARRRLLAASPGAALRGFESAIVSPMAAEAGLELDRIASPTTSSTSTPTRSADGVAERPASTAGDRRP